MRWTFRVLWAIKIILGHNKAIAGRSALAARVYSFVIAEHGPFYDSLIYAFAPGSVAYYAFLSY